MGGPVRDGGLAQDAEPRVRLAPIERQSVHPVHRPALVEPATHEERLGGGVGVFLDPDLGHGLDPDAVLIEDRAAGLARPQLVDLDVMREKVVAVFIPLVLQVSSDLWEALVVALVVVDHEDLVPDLLEEPDGGEVVPSQIPGGIDRPVRLDRQIRDPVHLAQVVDLGAEDGALHDRVPGALELLEVFGPPHVGIGVPQLLLGQDTRLGCPEDPRAPVLPEDWDFLPSLRIGLFDRKPALPDVGVAVDAEELVTTLRGPDEVGPLVRVSPEAGALPHVIGQHRPSLLSPDVLGDVLKLVGDQPVEVEAAEALFGVVDAVELDPGGSPADLGDP